MRQDLIRKNDLISLTAGVALILLAFLKPATSSIDDISMLAVSISLVTDQSVVVPASLGEKGTHGNYYSTWYPLLSFVSVPFVALGLMLGRLLSLPDHAVAAVFALIFQSFITAGVAAMTALLANRLGASPRNSILASLSYTFGTVALVYGRTFFAEPLLTLISLLSFCVMFTSHSRYKGTCLGLLTGLAVLTKPTGVCLGIALAFYGIFGTRKRGDILFPLIGTTIGFLVFLLYNYFRFEQFMYFGRSWAFSLSGFFEGGLGSLVSPGSGLFWYCPPVILGFLGLRAATKMNFWESMTLVVYFATFLIVHACWRDWSGGNSWGPRLLLPVLPGVCVFLGFLEKRFHKWIVVATLVGFLVNAPSLIADFKRYFVEAGDKNVSRHAMLWSFRDSPLAQGWGMACRTIQDADVTDVRELVSQVGPLDKRMTGHLGRKMVRVVALWWWMLPVIGVSRWVGAFMALLLSVLGCCLIVRAYRRSASSGSVCMVGPAPPNPLKPAMLDETPQISPPRAAPSASDPIS